MEIRHRDKATCRGALLFARSRGQNIRMKEKGMFFCFSFKGCVYLWALKRKILAYGGNK